MNENKVYFLKLCTGYISSEEDKDICTHYQNGHCTFFNCFCDDIDLTELEAVSPQEGG